MGPDSNEIYNPFHPWQAPEPENPPLENLFPYKELISEELSSFFVPRAIGVRPRL